METRTIKQRTITLELVAGEKIIVRRMKWKAGDAFLVKLAQHLGKLGTDLSDILPKLPEVIKNCQELVQHLVVNSSDLSAEQFENLDLVEALAVIEAAIELNLGEDLKNSSAGIAKTLKGLGVMSAIQMRSTASSTPISSMPATLPNT